MRVAAAAALVLTLAASTAYAQVAVSMHDGLVSVNATNATVRQILTEWARVGQTKIVNGDGVPGGPVTLQLKDVPEEEALAILLRTAAGYLAAPRETPLVNASRFDRVIVMPTSSPVRNTSPVSVSPISNLPQRIQTFPADQDDDTNGNPPPAPPLAQTLQERQRQLQQQIQQLQQGRGSAAFAPAPPPFPANAPAQDLPAQAPPQQFSSPSPAAPAGVRVPGMIVPAPQPAGQPPPQAR